jgi:hypothetical protein
MSVLLRKPYIKNALPYGSAFLEMCWNLRLAAPALGELLCQ